MILLSAKRPTREEKKSAFGRAHLRIASSLYRNTFMAVGLVLLAGASQLAGQTVQNPGIVVYGAGASPVEFAHQMGATSTPPPQTVRVYSAPANVQFTATAQTLTGGG